MMSNPRGMGLGDLLGCAHAFRISAEVDPAIVATEGQAALSLYVGGRSRRSGALDRDAVLQVTQLR